MVAFKPAVKRYGGLLDMQGHFRTLTSDLSSKYEFAGWG